MVLLEGEALDKELKERRARIAKIPLEVKKWVVGADDFIELLLICLLSGGVKKFNTHIFAEDKVGVGKTTIMSSFARACGGTFRRVQFRADMLPRELVETVMVLPSGKTVTEPGPLFANFVLADEINRASERSRSTLLEAMEEGQVTLGNTFILPRPLVVLATANPFETEGVFPLGVAQKDRFMMKVSMREETEEEALKILDSHVNQEREVIEQVITPEAILDDRGFIWDNIFLSEDLKRNIIRRTLVSRQLDNEEEKAHGASGKRSYIWLARGTKPLAFLRGRNYVTQDDVNFLTPPIFRHRISLGFGTYSSDIEHKIREIILELESSEQTL